MPAADQATAGSYNVTVTNPTPGGGTTVASIFTVNATPASNPVPTITTLSPNSVTVGAAAQTLTVSGTNFVGTSVVSFNNTTRTTTYVSATQLTIQLMAGDQSAAGSYNVTVTNPTPGGGTAAASIFTVNAVPAPTLTAISPSNPVGGVTYVFTLTGTDFGTMANTTVSFNGHDCDTNLSDRQRYDADGIAAAAGSRWHVPHHRNHGQRYLQPAVADGGGRPGRLLRTFRARLAGLFSCGDGSCHGDAANWSLCSCGVVAGQPG